MENILSSATRRTFEGNIDREECIVKYAEIIPDAFSSVGLEDLFHSELPYCVICIIRHGLLLLFMMFGFT